MLRPISIKDLDKTELVPQAVIRKPVSYFQDTLGIKFVESHDDLDVYEAAALSLNGTLPLVLKRYRGHPADTTTIYLSRELRDDAEVSRIIQRIIQDLQLTPDVVYWQRSDGPEL